MVGNSDGNSSRSRGEFLPQDVMINILKRLPVKSLARFSCVAKDWAKLFTTPHFISQHLHHSARHSPFLLFTTPHFISQHLHHSARHSPFLLLQRIPQPHESFLSSSSSCLIGPNLKVFDSQFLDFTAGKIVDACNGLLCLMHPDFSLSVCNAATRQIRQLPPSTLIDVKKSSYIGFGFSPVVDDYKIVRILNSKFGDYEDDQVLVPDDVHDSRVEVYSLATGSWKEIDATNLRNLSLKSGSDGGPVAADGAMFWLAYMSSAPDLELVVSFDIGQEVFTTLKGPPLTDYDGSTLTVYDNKLAIIHYRMGNYESCSFDLWVLDDTHSYADGGSWIKQYSVGPFSRILYPLRMIWRDEIVCLENLPGHIDEFSGVDSVLTIINPHSNELKSLPAHRDEYYYDPFNYEESLVQVANTQHEQ